jgi:hypothetical protein
MKIAIVLDGGCLRDVFCTDADAEVELIDLDNARDQDDALEVAEARVEALPMELSRVF